MPYNLTFSGSFFDIADFIKGVDSLVHTERLERRGRRAPDDARRLLSDRRPPKAASPTSTRTSRSPPTWSRPSQGVTAGATPTAPGPGRPRLRPRRRRATPPLDHRSRARNEQAQEGPGDQAAGGQGARASSSTSTTTCASATCCRWSSCSWWRSSPCRSRSSNSGSNQPTRRRSPSWRPSAPLETDRRSSSPSADPRPARLPPATQRPAAPRTRSSSTSAEARAAESARRAVLKRLWRNQSGSANRDSRNRRRPELEQRLRAASTATKAALLLRLPTTIDVRIVVQSAPKAQLEQGQAATVRRNLPELTKLPSANTPGRPLHGHQRRPQEGGDAGLLQRHRGLRRRQLRARRRHLPAARARAGAARDLRLRRQRPHLPDRAAEDPPRDHQPSAARHRPAPARAAAQAPAQ